MKFTVDQAAISAVTAKVDAFADRRGLIPILGCALIEASGDTVKLTTTDVDIAVTGSAGAVVAAPGAVCANIGHLRSFVKSARAGSQIEFSVEKGFLKLRSGRAHGSIATLPAEDFPVFATEGKLTHRFEIGGAELCRLFDGTLWAAAATDAATYYLCGVFLEFGADLAAVASDRNVLSLRRTALPDGAARAPNVIVPSGAVKILSSLADAAETCRVSLGEMILAVECGAFSLTAKLINGTFPEWRRVVPERSKKPATVERAALVHAAKAVARAAEANAKTRAVKMTLNGSLSLIGASDHAEFSDEIDASYSGSEIVIGVKANYLVSAAESLEADAIEIHVSGPVSPMLFCAEGEDKEFVVVMPYRI